MLSEEVYKYFVLIITKDVSITSEFSYVLIDKCLDNKRDSKHINVKYAFKKYKQYMKNLELLRNTKQKLNSCFLDIEREPLKRYIEMYAMNCRQCLADMNKNLSPFHWDVRNIEGYKCFVLLELDNYNIEGIDEIGMEDNNNRLSTYQP